MCFVGAQSAEVPGTDLKICEDLNPKCASRAPRARWRLSPRQQSRDTVRGAMRCEGGHRCSPRHGAARNPYHLHVSVLLRSSVTVPFLVAKGGVVGAGFLLGEGCFMLCSACFKKAPPHQVLEDASSIVKHRALQSIRNSSAIRGVSAFSGKGTLPNHFVFYMVCIFQCTGCVVSFRNMSDRTPNAGPLWEGRPPTPGPCRPLVQPSDE